MTRAMLTVFERIPDLFVELYNVQFAAWAAEFRRRGAHCAIVFARKPGAPALLDAEGRVIERGVWLDAEVDRSNPEAPRVIIRPASAHDEEMIARHVHEMRGLVLH